MVLTSSTGTKSQQVSQNDSKMTAPKKSRSKNFIETYSVYIYRVLKQVHPETGISKRSMSIMNSFINDVFERICVESAKLVNNTRKQLSDYSCLVNSQSMPFLKEQRQSQNILLKLVVCDQLNLMGLLKIHYL